MMKGLTTSIGDTSNLNCKGLNVVGASAALFAILCSFIYSRTPLC
jgi:hypothetical protein